MNKIPTIIILDPRWHGLSYLDAAVARGYHIIPIVTSGDCPAKYGYTGKYNGLIVNDLEDVNSVIKMLEGSKYARCIDAIIPGNCYFTPMANQIAAHLGLRGEPVEAALRSRLKDLGRKAYDAAGIPNTKYEIIHNLEEALLAAKGIGYPVILKPTDGGGSEHVTLVNDEAELSAAMGELLSLEKTTFNFKTRQVFLVEEFITGQEFSVELFMVDKEPRFASVTEKISSPLPYFVEVGHVVPTSVYADRVDELKAAALRAVLAMGFSNGPFHIELRLSPRGPIIMETNGRIAGGLIASDLMVNAFGINLFDTFIQYLLGNPVDITPTKNRASCIMNLIAKKDGRLLSIEGLDKLGQQENIVSHVIRVKPGDRVRLAREGADRLGYVISIAQTPEEAKRSAMDAISTIKLNIV